MADPFLPVVTGLVGFLGKSAWDQYWSRRNEQAIREWQHRTTQLATQLSEFFWPLLLRLRRDDAVWTHMLVRASDDPALAAYGRTIETAVLLPNHAAMVEIIEQGMRHTAGDHELQEMLVAYVRHAAVYRALREAGVRDRDPLALGVPWPKGLTELVEARTKARQAEYDRLMQAGPHGVGGR